MIKIESPTAILLESYGIDLDEQEAMDIADQVEEEKLLEMGGGQE